FFCFCFVVLFFFQAEDGIRDRNVTGVQTCALPISFAVPLSVTIVLALIAASVLFLGIRVRRWVQKGEEFDAIGATRTLALGQAAALVGAMQAGHFTAQIITLCEALPPPDGQAVAASAI